MTQERLKRILSNIKRTAPGVHVTDIKYNPNQPRVPAGNPTGGEWTRVGAGIKNKLLDAASDYGFPKDRLIISEGEREGHPETIAMYDPETGLIYFWIDKVPNEDVAKGLFSHEFTHYVLDGIERRSAGGGLDNTLWRELLRADWNELSVFSDYSRSFSGTRAIHETLAEAMRLINYNRKNEIPKDTIDILNRVLIAHAKRGME